MWRPSHDIGAHYQDTPEAVDAVAPPHAAVDRAAPPSILVTEVGNVDALKAYYDLHIDPKPDLLFEWINTFKSGTPVGLGWFETVVPHYLPHGIPGRHVSTVRASLAKISKYARSVSVRGRCNDYDMPLCHMRNLARLIREYGIEGKYDILFLYVEHYAEWRRTWGKQH